MPQVRETIGLYWFIDRLNCNLYHKYHHEFSLTYAGYRADNLILE